MKFGMVFPGQGSQAVGMLAGYGDAPEVRAVLATASEVLKQDIGKLIDEGPAEELNRTVNTQPVMLTAGYAVYRLWRELGGPEPAVVAGHSLGEYTALVAAGALAFEDALPLVRLRAQAMQEAVPLGEGAMAAMLGLDDDAVSERVRGSGAGTGRGGGQFQRARAGGDRGACRGRAAGNRRGESARRQACRDAAGERAVPFVAARTRRRAAGGGARGDHHPCAAGAGSEQRRCEDLRRARADQGCARPSGGSSGALGRVRPRHGRAGGEPDRRMRARQGACPLGEAHRRRRCRVRPSPDRAALEEAIAALEGA